MGEQLPEDASAAEGSRAEDDAAAGEPAEQSAGSSRRGRATAITTFLRVRPNKRGDGYFRLPDEGAGVGGTGKELPVVEVEVPKDELAGMIDNKRTHWRFRFDGVLGESSLQQEVFERVAEPVVASVLDGFNGTIFAYGQTGSGKTYTLTGGVDAYEERGIIPRALSHIYNHIAAAAATVDHTVRISYLEIYNQVQWATHFGGWWAGLAAPPPRRGGMPHASR
jgi:kinesin family protein 6/9